MITPLDIENKRFESGFKGYKVDEVDEFLDQVSEELEKKCKEISALKRELEQTKKDLNDCKGRESAIQNTLIVAQSTSDEIINNAKQQANQIIKDAEGTARQSVETLNQSIIIKKKEQEDLEKKLDVYKAKMESLLISQLELIKDMKKEEN